MRSPPDRPYAPIFHDAWRRSFGMPLLPYGGEMSSGGKLHEGFRSGTRAEYLAHYGLSRFSFVYQVPRQEDFGVIDFMCTLGNVKTPTLVYPEDAFYVQVKANDKHFCLGQDSVRWINEHMHIPLLICVADQRDQSLSLYSMSIVWELLFETRSVLGIKFVLNEDQKIRILTQREKRKLTDISHEVCLGRPILKQTISQIEKDKGKKAFDVIKFWARIERMNLHHRQPGDDEDRQRSLAAMPSYRAGQRSLAAMPSYRAGPR